MVAAPKEDSSWNSGSMQAMVWEMKVTMLIVYTICTKRKGISEGNSMVLRNNSSLNELAKDESSHLPIIR